MNGTNNSPVSEKTCPNCGRTISGRANKRYCDDNCRNNYYYKIYSEQLLIIRNVNATLIRNRMILRDLNSFGRKIVPRRDLVEKEFDFNYFTGIRKTKKGKVYYIVYDQAYSVNYDETVDLVTFKPQSLIRRMPASDCLEGSYLCPQIFPFDDRHE